MRSEDEGRFIEWWSAVEPAVLALGRRLLGSAEAARDLAQDIAVAALLRFDIFRDATHFRAWTLTRSRWLALDRLRIRRREHAGEAAATSEAVVAGDAGEAREIAALIAQLPERQREVLLRSMAGRSAPEIASELRVAPATIRSLLRHARLRLARAIDDGSK